MWAKDVANSTQDIIKEDKYEGTTIVQDKTFFTANSVTITRAIPVSKDDEEEFFGGDWLWNEQ